MTKDGKQLEKLIHLIESSIDPEAEVEHDIDMPILNSQIGAKTQCDIVIKTGVSPRQTITIVEVQDRDSKTKPNDFRGWKQKLKDVGAQHLICVSRKEFPKSVKEQASLSGNSIILITLKDDPKKIPLDFINFHYQFNHFDLTKLNKVQPTISKKTAIKLGVRDKLLSKSSINANEQCWSLDGKSVISLFILCRDFYSRKKDLKLGKGTINFYLKSEPRLYYVLDGIFIPAGLFCEFEWIQETIQKPASVLTYEQDEFGAMAWVFELTHISPKGKIVIKMPIIKEGMNYVIRSIYTELPPNVELTLRKNKKF